MTTFVSPAPTDPAAVLPDGAEPVPAPEPEPDATSTFYFNGWSGSDAWRVLTSTRWQTRAAAKKLARGPYKGLDFKAHALILAMPWGFFRVLDAAGNIEPCGASARPPI